MLLYKSLPGNWELTGMECISIEKNEAWNLNESWSGTLNSRKISKMSGNIWPSLKETVDHTFINQVASKVDGVNFQAFMSRI